MTKQPFTKPPLSVQEQIELLKARGLRIPDEQRVARYLRNISYYRLSGYMYPFLTDTKRHRYKNGTTFEDILNLYRFDRELRILIFAAIEKIEIAFRAQIINHYSVEFDRIKNTSKVDRSPWSDAIKLQKKIAVSRYCIIFLIFHCFFT